MRPFIPLAFLVAIPPLAASEPGVMESKYSATSFALSANPRASQWKDAPRVFATNGPRGAPVPGHRTEIRSRWSDEFLYLLWIAPYKELNLHPNPSTATETNKLWDWDVAEVFIGSDFTRISRYKELQVSPQSEWVDLDIDRETPQPEGGWKWNSGYKVKARIDAKAKIWYGEMQIPLTAIDWKPEMRINLYRIQGPPPRRQFIAWQPTNSKSYHVPEAFGKIRLIK